MNKIHTVPNPVNQLDRQHMKLLDLEKREATNKH